MNENSTARSKMVRKIVASNAFSRIFSRTASFRAALLPIPTHAHDAKHFHSHSTFVSLCIFGTFSTSVFFMYFLFQFFKFHWYNALINCCCCHYCCMNRPSPQIDLVASSQIAPNPHLFISSHHKCGIFIPSDQRIQFRVQSAGGDCACDKTMFFLNPIC